MSGGPSSTLGGRIFWGIVTDTLSLRFGLEGADRALKRPHVRPMDVTWRP